VADRLPHVMDRVGIWPAETSAAGSRTFLATVTSAARSCASSGVTLRAYETPSCASSRIGTAEARHEASWAAAHSATLRRGAARLGPALARGGPSGRPGSGTASPRDVSTAASEGLITRTGHLVPRSTRLTTLPTILRGGPVRPPVAMTIMSARIRVAALAMAAAGAPAHTAVLTLRAPSRAARCRISAKYCSAFCDAARC
jgi:hypothetical protein